MRSNSLFFWITIVLAALGTVQIQAADITDIEVEVTMDREQYTSGDAVSATVTQCNPTDEVITQPYNCPCCHDQIMLINQETQEVVECPGGCILIIFAERWEPGECKSRTFTWSPTEANCTFDEQVPDGTYRAQHIFQFTNPDHMLVTESPEFVVGSGPVGVPSLSALGAGLLVAILALLACFRLRTRRSETVGPTFR